MVSKKHAVACYAALGPSLLCCTVLCQDKLEYSLT